MRKLYQSMGGNMDDDVDNPALAREDLQCWYDNIEQCDGKTWLKRIEYIHVCGMPPRLHMPYNCIYCSWCHHGEMRAPMVI